MTGRVGCFVLVVLACARLAAAGAAVDVRHLTLPEAEKIAAENHPLVKASHYASLAAGETVREARSAGTFRPSTAP